MNQFYIYSEHLSYVRNFFFSIFNFKHYSSFLLFFSSFTFQPSGESVKEGERHLYVITSSMPNAHQLFSSVYYFFFDINIRADSLRRVYMHAYDRGNRWYVIIVVDCFTRSVRGCVHAIESNHSARCHFLFFCFCSEKEKIIIQNKKNREFH